VFVDGWTGTGVIARQLTASLAEFAASDGVTIPAELYVLTDLSGSAAVAASCEDYLIPSSVLNSTVSGLVSRSVYDPQSLEARDFHGCVYYQDFADQDLSAYFIETIMASVARVWQQGDIKPPVINRQHLQDISLSLLQWLTEHYGVSHANYIKPGIGEATRVLLRREARHLLLRDLNSEATRHLRWLAESKSIPIAVFSELPYQAVALIKELQL
jgi:Phosphoribosyl transferase (PRTase)/PELOTA RNA binding domain